MKALVKVILIIIMITSLFSDEVTLFNAIIPDFQVNENGVLSVARQMDPSISADSSGNFIIAWQDERNGNIDIYAQRYSSDGTALGSNFQVNDDQGSKLQLEPSISADVSGHFIITWCDARNNWDIYAQRYASDGTALGSNFQVNDDQGSEGQNEPSISADVSGNFIITWRREHNGNNDIYAQRYSSDGTALGSNFQVNDDMGSASQYEPSISTDVSGNFIITWRDDRNGNNDIYAQRYSKDGTALGGDFQVNDDQGSENQYCPSISADGSGIFIITWRDRRNGNNDIYAQRYSSDGTALGSNFQVNDDIGEKNQNCPSISADGSGNFIITWCDNRNSNCDIYAQRYSSDGIALGSNFKVSNDQGSDLQGHSSISVGSSGKFIISWWEGDNDADIYAQRYASDGTALGSNFQVNDDQGSEDQNYPSISADVSGNFIIAWEDWRNGDRDIYTQRYASDGTTLGSNFKVNDDQGSDWQGHSSISADSSGNFIIAWQDSRNGYFHNPDIYAQRYASDGIPLGSNFQVNDCQGSGYGWVFPSISVDGSGNFIIVWIDERNGNPDIYAQRYSSDGTALGSNFQVNEDTSSEGPFISADGSGNFIIAWQDRRNGNNDIYAQRYASDGTPLGSNFQVNDDMGSEGQYEPSISADISGNFIITWFDYRNNNYDIYAQRYSSDGTPLGRNFKVNDDQSSTMQWRPSVSADESGNFIIGWIDERNGNNDIYAQRYKSDGTALGSNFRVTNTSDGSQKYPKVKLRNNRIYSTWEDNRAGGTGIDIWANVLNWNDPNSEHQIPSFFSLSQNYPNPFNPKTNINYELSIMNYVDLSIYNMLGQKVMTLVNKRQNAGTYQVEWDATNFASGMYYYRIEVGDPASPVKPGEDGRRRTGEFQDVKKMILLR